MKRKPAILIAHNYYQTPGGEDTVVATEVDMLKKNGHKVVLYIRKNAEIKEMNVLQKLCLPLTSVFSFKTYREVKRMIREENIDILHVHNTLSLISPSIYYAAFACNVPVVQTVHNFRFLCPGATFYRDGHICEDCVDKGLKCALKHKCYRDSFLQTLCSVLVLYIHRMLGTYRKLSYIALTKFNKDKLLSLYGLKDEQIYIKPNAIENDVDIIPYSERKNQFVFVGRIEKIKGIEILLDAWEKMGKDAPPLFICGTGDMESWCKEQIKQRGLLSIQMLGFLPNHEVRKLLSMSTAIIFPTQWHEGFPMTIVESFSVGTPVIVSNIGNAASLVEDGKTGIKFRHDSSDALKEAIANMHDMVSSSYVYYKENFTIEKNYAILYDIYCAIGSTNKEHSIQRNERT